MWHYLNWNSNLFHSIVGWLGEKGWGGGVERGCRSSFISMCAVMWSWGLAAQRKHQQLSNNPLSMTVRGEGSVSVDVGCGAGQHNFDNYALKFCWNIEIVIWEHRNNNAYGSLNCRGVTFREKESRASVPTPSGKCEIWVFFPYVFNFPVCSSCIYKQSQCAVWFQK